MAADSLDFQKEGATQMAEASEVIDSVRSAYMAHDDETLLSHFAEDAHIIGTKAGESWTNHGDILRALRSDFGLSRIQGQLADLSPSPDVHVEGDLAWSVMEGRFDFGARSHLGRWTCVLKNIDDEWKVVHSHFSVPEGVRTP
ncbi:MAG: nuclear transport factor 2 family protein [Acidimicrobiia bacterium]